MLSGGCPYLLTCYTLASQHHLRPGVITPAVQNGQGEVLYILVRSQVVLSLSLSRPLSVARYNFGVGTPIALNYSGLARPGPSHSSCYQPELCRKGFLIYLGNLCTQNTECPKEGNGLSSVQLMLHTYFEYGGRWTHIVEDAFSALVLRVSLGGYLSCVATTAKKSSC